MNAPSRSGAPDASASASAARSASDQARPEAEHQQQLLQALTTEHFTLQTARGATIADSNGRAALYLSTVSGAVIALAFIGQIAHVGRAFFLFAFALLPALVLLGVLTYLRLLQTAVEDLYYARAINRIRHHYVHLDPDAARWFLLTSSDDPPAVMVNMGRAAPGPQHSRWHLLGHLLSHTATMAAAVTSIIGGVFVALAASALGAGALPVTAAAGVGVVVAVAGITAFLWHQARRWRAAEDSVPTLFPPAPPRSPPHPANAGRPDQPGIIQRVPQID
jgi:MFS family permease